MDPHVHKLEVGEFYCFTNEKIGRGSFAQVYKGYHRLTKQEVAVKVIDMEKLTKNNTKLAEHMRSEMEIMKGLKHENVVELLDARMGNDNYIYMVLEYCAGGDFHKFLSEQPEHRLSESRARHFLRQLACGLRFLRSRKIIHRDLKPQNLLLSTKDPETCLLKITDFGFAKLVERDNAGALLETLCGTPMYMAPEILRLEQYDVKADLWSVGVILWEMLTGKVPFKSRTPFELVHVIDNTVLKVDPSLGLSQVCLDLLYSLLQRDSVQRIGWEEFFLHPFLGFHQLNTPTPGTSPASLGTSPATGARPSTSPSNPNKPAVVQYGFFTRPPPMAAAPQRDLLGPAHAPTPPTPSAPQDVLRLSGRERSSSNPAHLVKTPPKTTMMPKVKSDPDMQDKQKVESLEKEFVLMAPGDAAESLPSSEEKLLAELIARENRANAIADIADHRMDLSLGVEALALYAKYLSVVYSIVGYCQKVVKAKKWTPGSALRSAIEKMQNRFNDYMAKSKNLQAQLKSTDLIFSAEKFLFEQALQSGKEAAVDEMLHNYTKAEYFYRTGLLLLEQLLADATDQNDLKILKEYISRFSIRLQEVQKKKDTHVYTKPSPTKKI